MIEKSKSRGLFKETYQYITSTKKEAGWTNKYLESGSKKDSIPEIKEHLKSKKLPQKLYYSLTRVWHTKDKMS